MYCFQNSGAILDIPWKLTGMFKILKLDAVWASFHIMADNHRDTMTWMLTEI